MTCAHAASPENATLWGDLVQESIVTLKLCFCSRQRSCGARNAWATSASHRTSSAAASALSTHVESGMAGLVGSDILTDAGAAGRTA